MAPLLHFTNIKRMYLQRRIRIQHQSVKSDYQIQYYLPEFMAAKCGEQEFHDLIPELLKPYNYPTMPSLCFYHLLFF